MFSVLWRRDSETDLCVCGRVHAWRDTSSGRMEVHVCTQTQGDANLQSVWLSQVDCHGVVSGKIGEHATFNLVSDFNDYLLSGQYCTGQHGGCRSCMWTWFLLLKSWEDSWRMIWGRMLEASEQVKMIENHSTSERNRDWNRVIWKVFVALVVLNPCFRSADLNHAGA